MLSLLISFLTACVSNTGPVVIRDAGAVSSTPAGSAGPAEKRQSVVRPVAPEKLNGSTASPLKTKLIAQSEKKLIDNDPKAAIILAERGLRIDRKEPRFYQVLASAYDALSNPSQSVYFAKQGLRYAKNGSEVYQSLSRWIK
jgi:Tfp pilus assembly protein PilF